MRRGRGWRSSWRRAGHPIPAAEEGTAGVDEEATPDRGAAEEHTEAHLVAPAERELDGELLASQHRDGADHRADLDVAVRAADVAVLEQRRLGVHDDLVVVLDRVQVEAHRVAV